MENQPRSINLGKWTIRYQSPQGEGPHPLLLLLHGWTGDETVMWIFTSRLARKYALLAPRGLYVAPQGGFGWHRYQRGTWPDLDAFKPAIEALDELLVPDNFPEIDFTNSYWMGFSQGAALGYAYFLLEPGRFQSGAGLSGFLPEKAEALVERQPLAGKKLFAAHGTLDERVPIDRARDTVAALERAGAQVTFCVDEVGHKLSATCFKAMESFFLDSG